MKNQKGMTLIELLMTGGLIAMVVGMSVTPILQMKKVEKKAEFQSSLNTAHQLAIQKARNSSYLKKQLGIETSTATTAGSAIEKCFGGRGSGCAFADVVDLVSFTQPGGYSAQSQITINVGCPTTEKCTQLNVQVVTAKVTGDTAVDWKNGAPLRATFVLPALALASRQEIDFSACVGGGKVVTGIDYETLIASCTSITGNTTCTSLPNTGPITTIGQSNINDPANCQTPPAITCATGMAVFGMASGQPQCVNTVTCVDALSANCQKPPVCVPKWGPLPNTICAGQTFTQTDANACPSSGTQTSVGTNAAVCVVSSCTLAGPVHWPNPVSGPCGVNSAAGTAAPGSSASLTNQNLGYYGTFTTACKDKSPLPSAFDFAGATSTCSPVVCAGLPAVAQWSAAGLKSGTGGAGLDAVGPWDCSGPQSIVQTPAQAAGVLLSIQADGGANATSTNTAASATAGAVTLTCNDPGPATAARAGVLSVSGLSCTPAPAGCPAGQVMGYDWVLEFMLAPDTVTWDTYGSTNGFSSSLLTAGTDRLALCDAYKAVMPNKRNCGPFEPAVGPKCGVLNPGTLPGAPPPPACKPNGYQTGIWSGSDDSFCVNQSSFAGFGPAPNPICCSGTHKASYGPADKIGGGDCNWQCVP